MFWFIIGGGGGESHGSFITGPRVQNTKIDRLWHEVVHYILFSFKNVFLYLEQMGLLICSNDIDLMHCIMSTCQGSILL